MAAANSISIVVPALNEQSHLERAVTSIIPAVERHFDDYEIFVYNDGSTDRTGEIADALAERFENVKAFHNKTPQNIGGVISDGLKKANKYWFIWVDGKGATPTEALDIIFSQKGKADLVVPYATNDHERSFGRRVIHNLYCGLLNMMFNMDLKSYTHLVLCRLDHAKRFPIRTRTYAYQSEKLVKLIKSGLSYIQVGVEDHFDDEARATKAFKPRNFFGVAIFFVHVFYDVYIRREVRKSSAFRAIAPAAEVHKSG